MTPRVLVRFVLAGGLAASATACSTDPAGAPRADEATLVHDYPTFRALHEQVVMPTCGPRGGVCHNSKQYPDLHTPEAMLAAVGQRCNELTEDPSQIQDLCEPPGDLLVLKGGPDTGWSSRVGYVIDRTPDGASELVISLHDRPPHAGQGLDFSIVRDTDPSAPSEIHVGPRLSTDGVLSHATVALDGLAAGLRSFFTAAYVPGATGQIFLGDPNRNGVFGADLGGALIKPGDVTRSFLVQRILGKVPPRMPLANGDLTAEQIYALQCWIFQLTPDGANADGPIDYARCPSTF